MRFTDHQERGLPLALHIAFGVAAGSIVASICIFCLWQWQMRAAAEEAATQLRASAIAAQAAAVRSAEIARRAEATKRLELAAAQRAVEERKRGLLEQNQQLEAEWARFYRKPAHCDEGRGGSWTVECANEFIRAKRAFAERNAQSVPR